MKVYEGICGVVSTLGNPRSPEWDQESRQPCPGMKNKVFANKSQTNYFERLSNFMCVILYSTILYYTILCVILCNIILYYTIPRSALPTARPRPAAALPRGAGSSVGGHAVRWSNSTSRAASLREVHGFLINGILQFYDPPRTLQHYLF